MSMKEYIINKLVKKFDISYEEASLFYYQLLNRRQLENFINNVDNFISFEEMKMYFLGGKYEL